ncbi:AI-2E family transporter [Rubripirellula reticaptiva]|uniref:AI-2 transport protein TqsA n=1 Tax=Rubripirellula reticaptiva TaxID=2528013 RepID=A0A5C6ESE9_9BACT|nr:AI-2E family transporter [Rubripirellula reticaptiva]TWU51240.1 AI-2 transport protein TqsA [Rubripirellula reticaptiva]
MSDTESQNEDTTTRGARVGDIATHICAGMLIMYALYFARSMAVPVVTSFVIYMVLRPIVRQGKRIGINPAIGSAGIIFGLLVALGLATYLVFEPAQQTIAEAPSHIAIVKEKLSFVTEKLQAVNQATEDLADTTSQTETSASATADDEPVPVEIKQPEWTSNVTYLSGTGNVVSFITICVALLYFLLATGDSLLRSIMHALPDFTARRRLVEVIANVQEGLGNYLAKISAINAGLGVSVALAMWLLGMPSPVLWGAMAFLFNFIPIVGAITGGAIIFVVALVNFDPTYYAFVVTALFLTLTSLEGQFITPAILGRSMSISPILVFLSIVLWGWMWGIMGVFLSVPILIAGRMACEGYDGLRPLAYVLGAEVPVKEAANSDEADQDRSVVDSDQHDTIPDSHINTVVKKETCPT